MKIEVNDEDPRTHKLHQVAPGEVFRFKGSYFLRADVGVDIVSVRLRDGKRVGIAHIEDVVVVRAVLKVDE